MTVFPFAQIFNFICQGVGVLGGGAVGELAGDAAQLAAHAGRLVITWLVITWLCIGILQFCHGGTVAHAVCGVMVQGKEFCA